MKFRQTYNSFFVWKMQKSSNLFWHRCLFHAEKTFSAWDCLDFLTDRWILSIQEEWFPKESCRGLDRYMRSDNVTILFAITSQNAFFLWFSTSSLSVPKSFFASATQFLKPSSPSSCSFCFTIRNMLWSCHVPVDFLCTKKHASLVCSSTVHLIFPEILAAYQGFAAKWCFDIWKYMDNIFSTFVNIWHAEVLEDEVHHSRVVDHYPASILVNISFLKLRVYMEWECGFQQFLKQSIYSEYIQERVPAYVRLQQLVQTAVGFEICTQLFDSVWS